jgi:hypothetical protein
MARPLSPLALHIERGHQGPASRATFSCSKYHLLRKNKLGR